MNEQRFTQLLGGIDPALIARAEAPVPMRKKPRFRRAMVAAIAALLAMSLLLGATAIALIPRTYDLDYEIPKQENASKVAQIYYLSENGKIKRQSVLLPPTEQNVFMTWAHLNGLGDEYALINIASSEGDPADSHVIITLSTELHDHPNAQSLLASLQKTFAHYLNVSEEQLSFSFPDTAMLNFSHDLPTLPARVYAGSVLSFTVTLTNESDRDIACAVTQWSATLHLDSSVYTDVIILPTESDNIKSITLAPGESKKLTYDFDLSSATPGTYDLELFYGEYSHTFKGAVQILAANSSVIGTHEFAQFLHSYGFDTADTSAFKEAVARLTYEGKGMFEIMNRIPTEYPEGVDGQDYFSDLFTYSYSRDASQEHVTKYFSFYSPLAIPDGMTLPCGITTEHSLQDALLAIGFDKQAAEDLLAQRSTVLLFSDGTHSFYLDYQQDTGRFAMRYKQSVALTPTCSAQYCLYLYYSPDLEYEYFTVHSSSEQSTKEPARYTQYAGYEVNWTFTPEQTAWLQEILDHAEWTEGLPLYTDYRFEPQIKIGNTNVYYTDGYFIGDGFFEATSEQMTEMHRIKENFPFFGSGPIEYWVQLESGIEAEPLVRQFDVYDVGHMLIILNRSVWMQSAALTTPEYGFKIGSKECGYDPGNGIFTVGNSFTVLSGEDKQFVDAIITRSTYQPQFTSIQLSGEDAEYAVPVSVAMYLRTVLNTDDWYDGQLNVTPELVFDCDGTTVSYAHGTFFTDGRYLYADSYTKDCMDALHLAMLNIRQGIADSIVYYMGEYYKSNEQVDQTHKDTVLPGGSCGILGDCANVVLGDASLTDATLWEIESRQNKILITDADGITCFERFTNIDPDFSGGTCRMILVDESIPCRSLTQEHQARLREIFENAEFFSEDTYSIIMDPGIYRSLTFFQINGYPIYYHASTGYVKIGNWQAQLSEDDQRTVYNIIGVFLAVG